MSIIPDHLRAHENFTRKANFTFAQVKLHLRSKLHFRTGENFTRKANFTKKRAFGF